MACFNTSHFDLLFGICPGSETNVSGLLAGSVVCMLGHVEDHNTDCWVVRKTEIKRRSHSSINDILRTTCKSRTPSCTVCCSCGTSHRWPAACAHANRKQPPSPFTFNSVNPDRSILYLPLHHHPSRPPHPHQGSLLSALPSGSPWASAFPSTTPVRPPVPFELHRQPFILGAFVDRSRFQGPNQLS